MNTPKRAMRNPMPIRHPKSEGPARRILSSVAIRRSSFLLALCLLPAAFCLQALAQGTAFTYQGRLTANNVPANGGYDFRFEIYDSVTNGAAVSGVITNADTPVTDGLFTVTLDFGLGVFTGAGRWLEIGVRGNSRLFFSTLAPRQWLTPTPYALRSAVAGSASNAVTVPWSGITGMPSGFSDGQDNNTTYTAGTGLTLSGSAFYLNTGYTDLRYWQLDGNPNTAFNTNFLGTTDNQPLEFRINGTRVLRLEPDATSPRIVAGYAGNRAGSTNMGVTISGGGASGLSNEVYAHFGTIAGGSGNSVDTNANNSVIGGGTLNAIAVGSSNSVIAGGNYGVIEGSARNATVGGGTVNVVRQNADYAAIGGGTHNEIMTNAYYSTVAGGSYNFAAGSYAAIPGGRQNYAEDNCFAAGTRAKALHAGSFVWSDGRLSDYFETTAANQFLIRAAGGVGIGTNSPQSALHVAGETTTDSINITGGADVAEPFPISEEAVAPGTVVVIDKERPGHLSISRTAYDKRVAGVVSGANGVNPGLTLRQVGILDGQQNLALSGRVYALADAAGGAIEPGDLLTTSDVPGHAMKVSDHSKAQGAVIGKAMSPLRQGRGLVLVLVNLQ